MLLPRSSIVSMPKRGLVGPNASVLEAEPGGDAVLVSWIDGLGDIELHVELPTTDVGVGAELRACCSLRPEPADTPAPLPCYALGHALGGAHGGGRTPLLRTNVF